MLVNRNSAKKSSFNQYSTFANGSKFNSNSSDQPKNPAKDDEKAPNKEPQKQKPNQEKKDLITI